MTSSERSWGTHLKIFQRQGLIKLWHDRLITAGEEWKGEN